MFLRLLTLLSFTAVSASPAERPNILVIVTDDQGWGDIGYHNDKVYTPNLDALARGGKTFRQHYSMPQCTPTRLALMTGRYPSRFGDSGTQASNEPTMPKGTLTMASFLQDQGYQTFLSGKWHLAGTMEFGPNHFGFDHSYGGLAGAVGCYDHRYRLNVPEFAVTWHRDHEIIPGWENGRHVTDLVTDDAVRIIKQERQNPFFLYLAYFAPHTPLDERGEFVDIPTQLDPDRPGRWLNEDKIRWFHDPAGKIQAEKDPEKRLFLAVLHHLDDGIGQVVKALDESGQRDNTLILFTSDNGPQINWPGNAYPSDLKVTDINQEIPFRGSKTDTYEGGMRVPGFAHWPGTIQPGEIDEVQHVIDWLPTIAGVLDAKVEIPADQPPLDGQDRSSRLLGTSPAEEDEAEVFIVWGNPSRRKESLRLGDWKIVRFVRSKKDQTPWELYHLGDDPTEEKDLAKNKPEVLERLATRFDEQRSKDRKGPNVPK